MFRWSSVLISAACTGENVIEKQQNIAPSVSLVSHSEGAELQEGYAENFRAIVSDDDNGFDELQVAWYVGEDIVCDWGAPSPAGDTFCDIALYPEDTAVMVTVRDPQGSGSMAEVGVTVSPTEAPIVEILEPTPGQVNYSSDLIQFSAIIQDLEDDTEDLIITWNSNIDGELSLNTDPDSTGEISDYIYLSEGQHAIELSVTDTSNKTTVEEVVLRVGGENQVPDCEIILPADQSTVLLGETVILTGIATDEDIPNTDLSTEWRSDQDGSLGAGSINSGGELSFSFSDFTANTHVITLQVTDETGASCQDTIFLHVGEPPTATINSPTNGDIFTLSELVVFQGTVSDGEDQLSSLETTWTSSLDGELSSGFANSQGVSQLPSSALSAGLHSVTFSVMDSDGLIAEDYITFRVNSLPTQATVTLSPDPAVSNTSLSAFATGSTDDDGQNVTYQYEWLENSVLTTYTSSMIPASELDVGEIWTARVTPTDGYGQGNFTEASLTISNTDPVITTAVISPNISVYRNSVLTCSATATDVDETVIPTFAWTVGGYTLTGSTLDLANISVGVGEEVTCTANVSDSNGGQASSSSGVTILNRSPSIDSISVSPNSPSTSATLTCQAITSDLDGDAVTVTYSWTVNGSILGTQSILELQPSLVSPQDLVTCNVTATDSVGDSVAASQAVQVQNTAPVIDSLILDPSTVYVSDTVECLVSASDVDLETLSYQLTLEDGAGQVLASSSQSSISLDISNTSLIAGDNITCVAEVTDPMGQTTIDSTQVSISNSVPVFDVPASISSDVGSVKTGANLTCSASATDPNQGSISLSYVWQVGSVIVSSTEYYTVNANESSVGDIITCTVTAVDSDGEMSTSSTTETILNTVPVIDALNITTGTGLYNDSTLTCVTIITDPDEGLSPSIIWEVAGGVVGTGTTLDVATTAGMPNDDVNCIVNVTDSNGGSASNNTMVTLLNRAPSTPSISISPSSPEEGVDSLTCSMDVASQDDDGHSISYTYQWEQNGNPAGYSSTTVPMNVLVTGDEWTCLLTATDGLDDSITASDSVIVVSPVPTIGTPSNPGMDCADIMQQNPGATDDTYWISPNGGSAFQAYCLMSINGGGWTVQTYIRASSQWDISITANNGTIGDVNNGFSSGGDLSASSFQVTEKIVVYLRLIEGGVDLGMQWMSNDRSSPVSYSSLGSNQSGWGFEDSFGGADSSAGNVCSHGCSTFRGFGMFHDYSGIGYHGTQTGDYGCRDGNNICWNPRGGSCNVGSYRCSYLTGTQEGVIYAVR